MEVNKIFFIVITAIFNLYNMVGMQWFSIKQRLSTHWALPVLVASYFVKLRTFFPIRFAVLGLTVFPVIFETGVVWGCSTFDLDMTLNGNVH